MAPETIPSFVGRSGLSEEELSSLWERVREKWPVAFNVLSRPLDREEGTRWDAVIHDVVREKFPDLPSYPDHDNAYSDMKYFQGWQRVRAIVDRSKILDEDDYWVARNSPLAYSKQLSASHLHHLQQLVRAYEQAR